MPATSTAQRRLMSIAEHHPDQLYAKNRGVLSMSHKQLHDFAAVKEKGLPHHKKAKKKVRSMKRGGMVLMTALYRLHAGERVIPADKVRKVKLGKLLG